MSIREHVIRWYETEDGEIFTDEEQAMEYEINAAYNASGVRLYSKDGELIESLDDNSYDNADMITIDRSKSKENERFKKTIRYYYGWELIEKAIDGAGINYRLLFDRIEELKE